jgi:hypothetical protein
MILMKTNAENVNNDANLYTLLKFFRNFVFYHGYYKPRFSKSKLLTKKFIAGDRHFIKSLHNKFKGRRCFVIGNGPSLSRMNLDLLVNEVTIGSNGLYKLFDKFKFRPSYLLFQDSRTILGKAREINAVKGIPKLVSINASHLIKKDNDTYFFNLANHLGWENIKSSTRKVFQGNLPIFSNNFAEFATNMGNVSHTAIQFAFFLGCNPVYLIGCDHSMAALIDQFEPGHVKITESNLPIFEKHHFTQNYYKIGDEIGVPFIELENQAYKSCNEFFNLSGRQLRNAGLNSKVPFIPKVEFESLF